MTEGILTRWLQRDPALEGVAARDLRRVSRTQPERRSRSRAVRSMHKATLREDLKLLVMSATLDGEAVAKLLGEAPIVTSLGTSLRRRNSLERRRSRVATPAAARASASRTDREQRAAATILQALETGHGDILVFLPGQGEIRRVQRALEEASLPQQRARAAALRRTLGRRSGRGDHDPAGPGERKIVLATNIAETSLTIEGVRIVIDSGLARRSRFDPATGMSRSRRCVFRALLRINAAAAPGDWKPACATGCGARASTRCSPRRRLPEIVEADLAPAGARARRLGRHDPQTLRWLDAPPSATLRAGARSAACARCTRSEGRVTAHGRALARIGDASAARAHDRARRRSRLAARGARDRRRTRRTRSRCGSAARTATSICARDSMRCEARPDPARRSRRCRRPPARDAQHRIAGATTGRRAAADCRRWTMLTSGRLLALAYPDRIAQSRGAGGRYLLSSGRGAILPGAQASCASRNFSSSPTRRRRT